MSAAYHDLRKRARALALATIFDKSHQRDLCCDVLHLGLELEKIVEMASEPMLAMIRIQWWYDCFEGAVVPSDAPELAKRLYHYDDIKPYLLTALQNTQESLQTDEAEADWSGLFQAIAIGNDWQIDTIIIRQLGQNLGSFYRDDNQHAYQPFSDKQLRQACEQPVGFIRLVNLLCQRQKSASSNEDFLLIIRYLWRLLH